MIFTSFVYLYFFLTVFSLYWWIGNRKFQNILLLVTSYIFYGWIHPWFCILIAITTYIDYLCGLGIRKYENQKKQYVLISVFSNLGMLAFFKYFNFFTDNVIQLLALFEVNLNVNIVRILLPVGISFYTFQSLSYVIDIYREKLEPCNSLIDFATFVIFFPQLVAGPIERARNLLPQLQHDRKFDWRFLEQALPLLITGYLKKLVIADNIAVYANYVYMYDNPPFLLLVAGTAAFALQIYTDFSAYTDIARGSAKLMGFDLMENFNSPYFAISPSDFWRRWHISFSSFIKEYLYIPLGGSRVKTRLNFAFVAIGTLCLSGLWHGAAWNFILWGLYNGILVFVYHQLSMGGHWKPKGIVNTFLAWLAMSSFTLGGWFLFRAPDIMWIKQTLSNMSFATTPDISATAFEILFFIVLYSIPLLVITFMNKVIPTLKSIHFAVYGALLASIFIFFSEQGQDFIYFQF